VIVRSARLLAATLLAATAGHPGGTVSRRDGQQLARRELARSMYQESLKTRVLRWLERLAGRIFDATNHIPGGLWTTVVLAIGLVLVAALVAYWIRPGRGRPGRAGAILAGTARSARSHRELAARSAAAGDFGAAIVEQVRAIAADIEERGILPAGPGRTADEFAAEAGRALPQVSVELAAAAQLFDDVRYGGRPGTAAGYGRVRDLDDNIRSVRAGSQRPATVAAAP
jgi:hypothetical protein